MDSQDFRASEAGALDLSIGHGERPDSSIPAALKAYLDSRGWAKSLGCARGLCIDGPEAKLHLTVWESRPEHPCVIFVHGMGLHSLYFVGFMSKLSERGYNVFGLDIQGHGRSGGERGHFTMQRATENVSSVINYIHRNYHDRVGVMGISLGGMVTFYSVANDPRIRSAVCAGLAHPRLPLRGRFMRLFIGMGASLMPRKRLSLLRIVPLEKVTSDPVLQDVMLSDDLVVPKYTLQTVASFTDFDPKIPFEEIRTPILVMVGELEQISLTGILQECVRSIENGQGVRGRAWSRSSALRRAYTPNTATGGRLVCQDAHLNPQKTPRGGVPPSRRLSDRLSRGFPCRFPRPTMDSQSEAQVKGRE